MFDLNTLFNTAGTAGMLGGMGEGSPAGAGGFAGMADGGMEGFGALLGSIDPKVMAQLAQTTQPGTGQIRPPAGGLGSPLRAGQIQDASAASVKRAQAAQDVGARKGLGQLIYGR